MGRLDTTGKRANLKGKIEYSALIVVSYELKSTQNGRNISRKVRKVAKKVQNVSFYFKTKASLAFLGVLCELCERRL